MATGWDSMYVQIHTEASMGPGLSTAGVSEVLVEGLLFIYALRVQNQCCSLLVRWLVASDG